MFRVIIHYRSNCTSGNFYVSISLMGGFMCKKKFNVRQPFIDLSFWIEGKMHCMDYYLNVSQASFYRYPWNYVFKLLCAIKKTTSEILIIFYNLVNEILVCINIWWLWIQYVSNIFIIDYAYVLLIKCLL